MLNLITYALLKHNARFTLTRSCKLVQLLARVENVTKQKKTDMEKMDRLRDDMEARENRCWQ
jgi:hypothetical protein